MRIVRVKKNEHQHTTVPLCNDEDRFEFSIDRNEAGCLRIQAEDYSHTFTVLFTKNEESELLSKLKSAGVFSN